MLQPNLAADIGLHMLANHVDTAKQNAVVKDLPAVTVKTSRYSATMPMVRGIALRSTPIHISRPHLHSLTPIRQFGSMAEKVSDYERILRDLQTRVSEDDANLIRNSLDRVHTFSLAPHNRISSTDALT